MQNLRASRSDRVYIFTLPPCINGTVVSFEFCFMATNSDVESERSGTAFYFLSLVRSSNGRSFTINARYSLWSIAQNSTCTPTADGSHQICCRRSTNFHTPFPVTRYFGIVMQQFKLLTFAESSTEYVAEQYQLNLTDDQATRKGALLPINANQVVKPLLLLRIFIGKCYIPLTPIIGGRFN